MRFTRGKNEPCVYYHATLDLVVIVYVDDLLIDGDETSIKWFYAKLSDTYKCGELDWLTPKTPIDYLGLEISMDEQRLYISMSSYIRTRLLRSSTFSMKTLAMCRCHPRFRT